MSPTEYECGLDVIHTTVKFEALWLGIKRELKLNAARFRELHNLKCMDCDLLLFGLMLAKLCPVHVQLGIFQIIEGFVHR